MGLSNYPPGVTGNEYEIAGADWEEEDENTLCPEDHSPCLVQGYRGQKWGWCFEEGCAYNNSTGHSFDIVDPYGEVEPPLDNDDL